MDKILAPSILAADFMRLGEQIRTVRDAGAEYLHYDVMDGIFVPSISFGLPVLKSVRTGTDMFIDCHLMITEPYRYIGEFAKAGADSITVHVEACKEHGCAETIGLIREYGKKAAVSLNPGTPADEIAPFLDLVDMVLVMSVEPGFGGQKFIESTNGKVERLVELRSKKGLGFDIEVDGGVTADNLASIIDAGVNVIVSGSSIFKGDIEANVRHFKDVMNR